MFAQLHSCQRSFAWFLELTKISFWQFKLRSFIFYVEDFRFRNAWVRNDRFKSMFVRIRVLFVKTVFNDWPYVNLRWWTLSHSKQACQGRAQKEQENKKWTRKSLWTTFFLKYLYTLIPDGRWNKLPDKEIFLSWKTRKLTSGHLFWNNNTWSHVFYFSFRTVFGVNRIPEKEPWVEWHLFQRPGFQISNKSDFTAADEVCVENRRWNELLVIKICELQQSFSDDFKNREKLFFSLLGNE